MNMESKRFQISPLPKLDLVEIAEQVSWGVPLFVGQGTAG